MIRHLVTIYAAGMIAASIVLLPHIETRGDSLNAMAHGVVMWPISVIGALTALELAQ